MKLLVQASLFSTAACVCNFQLSSVGAVGGTVLEDHVGDLLLGGTFQQGGFSLDRTSKTIQDGLKHNCFIRSPDFQFRCYQGAVGTTKFDIAKEDGKLFLTYDDINGPGSFYACPSGSTADQVYDIFSQSKGAECKPVALALTNESPECSTVDSTIETRSTVVSPTRSQGRQSSSPVCSVSPSAPSLAPFRLRPGNSSILIGGNTTSAEAAITPVNSTIFEYAISDAFISDSAAGKSSLCALQFRLPVCTSLPKGYPCYSFSGLEQEVLANSGMNFHLMTEEGVTSWNQTELHQVFPGENTIIGTFKCGRAPAYGVPLRIGWQVSSVRDFALEFIQAGVGHNAEFQDGIGAWIVPCQ
ncbi:hypothetical protein GGS26DRAFT_375234 [Hypomontagnella submonticulosa]|nr:hypothetical protein GGS26DRAFT_375234 [Hypomontagnella submonticulosa]